MTTPPPASQHPLDEPEIAYDRKETDPCERGTRGCCIAHTGGPDSDCQTW